MASVNRTPVHYGRLTQLFVRGPLRAVVCTSRSSQDALGNSPRRIQVRKLRKLVCKRTPDSSMQHVESQSGLVPNGRSPS